MLHRADGADFRRAGLVHLAGPVPGGVTAFPAFPAHERSCPPGRQPIEKIMARCGGVRRCAGAIRDLTGGNGTCVDGDPNQQRKGEDSRAKNRASF
jgi:hypothetical protein